jgi:hypothetical protein
MDAVPSAQSFTNVSVAGGLATITGLTAGTYNDLTITSLACASTEDVDIVLTEVCIYDWGDLPDTGAGTDLLNYETTAANNGPYHVIVSGLFLGASVDEETDGQASSDALGDGADEDAFVFGSNLNLVPGITISLPINITNMTGSTAHFEMWIDWNGDGDFDDTGEMVANLSDDTAGDFGQTHVVFTIPAGATIDQLIGVRARLSNTDNMTPYGLQLSGEVEDYLIQIKCAPKVCLPVTLQIKSGTN